VGIFRGSSVVFKKEPPQAKKYKAKLVKKHGKAKALTILAHKLARATYYILKRKEVFNMEKFLKDR